MPDGMMPSWIGWFLVAFYVACAIAVVIVTAKREKTAAREKRFWMRKANDAEDSRRHIKEAYAASFEQHQDMVLALVKMGEVATVIPLDPYAELKVGQTRFRVGDPMALADLILQEWEAREAMLWACIKGDTGILICNDDGTTEEYAPGREVERLRAALENANRGIEWWCYRYPETASECDDEALTAARATLRAGEPDCQYKGGGCNGKGEPCGQAHSKVPEAEECYLCGHHLNCCILKPFSDEPEPEECICERWRPVPPTEPHRIVQKDCPIHGEPQEEKDNE